MSMCVREKGRICGERDDMVCVCLLCVERAGGGGTKREGVSA